MTKIIIDGYEITWIWVTGVVSGIALIIMVLKVYGMI